MRPETNSMQFGEDWCGTFIRGDMALYYSHGLKNILNSLNEEQLKDFFGTVIPLKELISLLDSCEHRVNFPGRQFMKSFEQCKKG